MPPSSSGVYCCQHLFTGLNTLPQKTPYSFFTLEVLQLGVQCTLLHSPRLRDQVLSWPFHLLSCDYGPLLLTLRAVCQLAASVGQFGSRKTVFWSTWLFKEYKRLGGTQEGKVRDLLPFSFLNKKVVLKISNVKFTILIILCVQFISVNCTHIVKQIF